MDAVPSQVFFPSNFQELFSAWSRFPEAIPYAGGTGIIRNQDKRIPILPRNIISLDRMEDMRRITRTERYLEVGAMVRLSEIISLGKIVPEILTRTLERIGGPALRNLATIGGSLCCPIGRLDTSAPLVALDAHYELRSAGTSRWISATRFSTLPGPPALAPQELLTRIRIPLERWNYSLYCKFKPPGTNEAGGVIVFILKNQKNTLTDLRVVYSGSIILQDRNSEALLIGKQLPLDRKEARAFLDSWKHYLQVMENTASGQKNAPDMTQINLLKIQIINFIGNAIIGIAD
jgi:CO/xanthine dehydrogenase FAD-binding subunit